MFCDRLHAWLFIQSRLTALQGHDGRSGLRLNDGTIRIFSVGISVSPHVCFILDLILISIFLR